MQPFGPPQKKLALRCGSWYKTSYRALLITLKARQSDFGDLCLTFSPFGPHFSPCFFLFCGVWVLLCLVLVVWLCLFGLCGCCFCFVSLFFVARNNGVVASGWQPMLEIDKDALVA